MFGGITDRLIPLFAVGAFLSFTLSQAGMAAHWLQHGRGRADQARLAINGLGAVATGLALIIILMAKFTEGAWLTVLVIPATLFMLHLVHRYYAGLDRQLLSAGDAPLDLTRPHAPHLLILDRPLGPGGAEGGCLRHAPVLRRDGAALHRAGGSGRRGAREGHARPLGDLRRRAGQHERGLRAPTLLVRSSPYRSVLGPLLRLIAEQQAREPGQPIAVVLPQLVEGRWWERFLHTHRERRLRDALLADAGPDLAVIGVPWQLHPIDAAHRLAVEEPGL